MKKETTFRKITKYLVICFQSRYSALNQILELMDGQMRGEAKSDGKDSHHHVSTVHQQLLVGVYALDEVSGEGVRPQPPEEIHRSKLSHYADGAQAAPHTLLESIRNVSHRVFSVLVDSLDYELKDYILGEY